MNVIANYMNAFKHNFTQIPQIVCEDGFAMSVQASVNHYTSPRRDFDDARMYDKMEVGFPNMEEELLKPYVDAYSDEEIDYLNSVYGFVPVEIINEVIVKHGGLKRPF